MSATSTLRSIEGVEAIEARRVWQVGDAGEWGTGQVPILSDTLHDTREAAEAEAEVIRDAARPWSRESRAAAFHAFLVSCADGRKYLTGFGALCWTPEEILERENSTVAKIVRTHETQA
jgi:hypothetical protein